MTTPTGGGRRPWYHLAMTTNHRRSVAAAVTFILLSACSRQTDDLEFAVKTVEMLEIAPELEIMPPQATPAGPLLIRSGSARIEVARLDSALAVAGRLVEGRQGFIAGSQLHEGREGARTATLLLRLPSDAFEPYVAALSDLGRVLSVSIDATDVSQDYVDVETRLAVQDETVRRLRQLASRSGDLEDVLAAERELGRATSELESLKGKLRYYDQRLALSDLRLTLTEPGALVTAGAFRPVTLAVRNATDVLGQSLAFLVYAVVFLIPWLILAAILWPVARRIRLRRRPAGAAVAHR